MNKKGFTLVELLAVIVILAIILAIAVPTINNLIANSKKSMFENSSKMILRSMKNDYDGKMAITGSFTDTFILYDNGVRTVYPSSNNLDFTISATDGGIVRHSDGTITMSLYDGTNCITKLRTSNDITSTVTDKATCISNIIYKQANAPFTNLVTNGDFTLDANSDGIADGFTPKQSVISASNNILIVTSNSYYYTGVGFNPLGGMLSTGDKYYINFNIEFQNKLPTSRFSIEFDGSSTRGSTRFWDSWENTSLKLNVAYDISGISNVVTQTGYPIINIVEAWINASDSQGAVMKIKNISLVNLTQVFGTGNEPTQAQMNHNINKVWIDTTNENTPKKFGGGGWIGF